MVLYLMKMALVLEIIFVCEQAKKKGLNRTRNDAIVRKNGENVTNPISERI